MESNSIKKMGFIEPMTVHQICRQHNGVQAQVRSYADVGFLTRMSTEDFSGSWSLDLVRQWSVRGTHHAYLKEDIPLYLYEGRNYLKPNLSLPTHDGKISAKEKGYYGDLILGALASGHKSRDELKEILIFHQLYLSQGLMLFCWLLRKKKTLSLIRNISEIFIL